MVMVRMNQVLQMILIDFSAIMNYLSVLSKLNIDNKNAFVHHLPPQSSVFDRPMQFLGNWNGEGHSLEKGVQPIWPNVLIDRYHALDQLTHLIIFVSMKARPQGRGSLVHLHM